MTFPAEGFCVNGITRHFALGELALQVSYTRLVLDKTLPKRSLALQETTRRFFSLSAETSQTVEASFGGFVGLLSAIQVHALLHNAFHPLPALLAVFLLQLCQLLGDR